MDKKELKFYEAPVSDVFEMEAEGFLCASTNAENATVDTIEFEDED